VVTLKSSLRRWSLRVTSNKEATETRFTRVTLKSSLRRFNGRHHDLVDRYGMSVQKVAKDIFGLS
jgi:hypothetical protein